VLRCHFERLKRNLTQDDVARGTRIIQSDISAIERGRLNPTLGDLEALSTFFGLPAEALLKEVVPAEEQPQA
jgi:transcriptional regulator with XRE-family HTH domain